MLPLPSQQPSWTAHFTKGCYQPSPEELQSAATVVNRMRGTATTTRRLDAGSDMRTTTGTDISLPSTSSEKIEDNLISPRSAASSASSSQLSQAMMGAAHSAVTSGTGDVTSMIIGTVDTFPKKTHAKPPNPMKSTSSLSVSHPPPALAEPKTKRARSTRHAAAATIDDVEPTTTTTTTTTTTGKIVDALPNSTTFPSAKEIYSGYMARLQSFGLPGFTPPAPITGHQQQPTTTKRVRRTRQHAETTTVTEFTLDGAGGGTAIGHDGLPTTTTNAIASSTSSPQQRPTPTINNDTLSTTTKANASSTSSSQQRSKPASNNDTLPTTTKTIASSTSLSQRQPTPASISVAVSPRTGSKDPLPTTTETVACPPSMPRESPIPLGNEVRLENTSDVVTPADEAPSTNTSMISTADHLSHRSPLSVENRKLTGDPFELLVGHIRLLQSTNTALRARHQELFVQSNQLKAKRDKLRSIAGGQSNNNGALVANRTATLLEPIHGPMDVSDGTSYLQDAFGFLQRIQEQNSTLQAEIARLENENSTLTSRIDEMHTYLKTFLEQAKGWVLGSS